MAAPQRDILLAPAQRLAIGDAQHLAHQVHASHGLGDGMLDLDARVHLDEIEILRATAVVVQELQRAGAAIADRARQLRRRFAQALARGGVQRGRGRFLEHLLATPLQRAFAFIKMDGVLAVAQHLHFDVPRAVAFQIDAAIAECRLRLGLGLRHLRAQLGLVLHHADAAPAAAAAALIIRG